MAVAKTYESMEIVGEVFEENGKKYVKVVGPCKRCGGSGHFSYNSLDGTICFGCRGSGREAHIVRWYTDAQRASMDKQAEKRAAAKQEERRQKFLPRNAFGFGEAGYITLYKGDQNHLSDYFKSFTIDEEGHRAAWFSHYFGWYTPSKLDVPTDLPAEFSPITLTWDEVKKNDEEMKPIAEVMEYVNSLLFEPSTSEYQGEVGQWLELPLTIKKNIKTENRFGTSTIHIMEDESGNQYFWSTGSKSLEEGKAFNMKVKVKEHKEYNGVKQTVVWYCKVK